MNSGFEATGDKQDHCHIPMDGQSSQDAEKKKSETGIMKNADVMNGVWQSELPGLMYIITQVGDRFTWRVMHKNGEVETGIGQLLPKADDSMFIPVEAQWNVYSPQRIAAVRSDTGYMRVIHGRACEIQWASRERFFREK